MDTDKLHREMDQGQRAKNLVDSEVFQSAVTDIRNGIIQAWETAPIRDRDGQHELKLMMKLLNDLTANLRQRIDTGKMAGIQLQNEQTLLDRAKGRAYGLFRKVV